jgi:glycosyltransferase involved in cell wall biosynthesis
MKFLWVIGSLDPIMGGPVVFLEHLAGVLGERGHLCEVVTLDGKLATGVHDFPGVVHAIGPSWGKYGYNTRLVPWLQSNANRFDATLVSGLWQYPGIATRLVSRKVRFPYFVFTHGMLDPWFKIAYPLKHIKKSFYWPWGEYRVLRDATGVFFTSAEEKKLASHTFKLYRANEVVVNLGIAAPPRDPEVQRQKFLDEYPSLRGKRLILFLSRLHPKKGCDLLIKAFARIANRDQDMHLVMAGPDQENWQFQLREEAARLNIERRITWTGMLNGDLKWGAYAAADVFILPSHSENFGIVVAEALACNLPVLITDKVNIWREITYENAGMVGPDTLEGIFLLLQKWLFLGRDDRAIMRANARNCYLQRFEIRMVAENFVKTIRPLIETYSECGNHVSKETEKHDNLKSYV